MADLEHKSLEGRYARLNSQVNDIVLLFDKEARILEANDRAVACYGYSRDELLRMTMHDLRGEAGDVELPDGWQTLMKQGSVIREAEHRRKDGSRMPVEISARVVESDESWFCQTVLRDVSERKRAEEELRRVTRALRVLSACNQAVVRSHDEDRSSRRSAKLP